MDVVVGKYAGLNQEGLISFREMSEHFPNAK